MTSNNNNYVSDQQIEEFNVSPIENKDKNSSQKDEKKKYFLYGCKTISYQWLCRATGHGFSKLTVVDLSILIKLLWAIAILVAWLLLIIQLISLVNTYHDYKVVSYSTIGYETPTLFPAIDICNLNAYDGNLTRDLMDEILSKRNINTDNVSSLMEYTDLANNYFKSVFENKSIHGELDVYDSGFYLNQMLISCEYQGKPCKYNDFYWYHDYNYGNCYRFNGNDQDQFRKGNNNNNHEFKSKSYRLSSRPGTGNGLRLELYVGDPDHQQQYTYESGIRVIIHNQSIVPLPDVSGIDVPTGFLSNIGITRNFVNKLPKPYSDCINDLNDTKSYQTNEYIEEIILMIKQQKMNVYQQEICLKLCNRDYFKRECGCIDFSLLMLESDRNLTRCYSDEQIDCLNRANINYFNSKELTNCYTKCPLSCQTMSYETKITMSEYPTVWYASQFNNTYKFINFTKFYGRVPTYDLIKKTTLIVNIYYESVTYSVIDEQPVMPFDLLLSSLGGYLGLFTGSSLLSFVELIEIVILFAIFLVQFKRKFSKSKQYKTKKTEATTNTTTSSNATNQNSNI